MKSQSDNLMSNFDERESGAKSEQRIRLRPVSELRTALI